jgi:hypothetical protein
MLASLVSFRPSFYRETTVDVIVEEIRGRFSVHLRLGMGLVTNRELRALLEEHPDDLEMLMTKDGNEYWPVDSIAYINFDDGKNDDAQLGLVIESSDYEVDIYGDPEDPDRDW